MGEIFITRRGGEAPVPSVFGNGNDGDAVISGTVILPVPVPHQSIVEMQYKSLTINAGAILKAAAHNAGLIIRVKGDCVIHGTIDQSGLAPKINPQNTYAYPAQLVCGNGGNGGNGQSRVDSDGDVSVYGGTGGTGMLKRPYGGGYGGGAGGGAGYSGSGYNGGSSTGTTVDIANIFVGGYKINGSYGGGGAGGSNASSSGGNGGNGPGADGEDRASTGVTLGGGGGAGNYGGGVILLYVGGKLIIDGQIFCNGLNGGRGGSRGASQSGNGSGGGGGGGGAIYLYYKGLYTNTGIMQVNGGNGGTAPSSGTAGAAGGVGSITVIQHTN